MMEMMIEIIRLYNKCWGAARIGLKKINKKGSLSRVGVENPVNNFL